ncbi:MAG: ABC transporter ATP-binding protein [Acidimicrobiales bacterium]|jgi:molybdate transport system ATP-binding protein|nr:ABC transporter ATP-binding protein [Acidimicrobiales bacterium]
MLEINGSLDLEYFTLKVELEIKKNETICLLGPNGSGKSTILKLVGGLKKLTVGDLKINGTIVDSGKTFVHSRFRNVGWVPQNQMLFDHLTVKQNIEFSPNSSKKEVSKLIELFDLQHIQNKKAGNCSGGESQRVAISRAIASKPQVLLLDEPSTGLDEKSRQIIYQYLKTQKEVATLLITHDPIEAASLSERLIILEKGEITQSGAPDEIRNSPATPYSASLVGLNFVPAVADGLVAVTSKGAELILSESVQGQVNIVIPPKSIALYREKPVGSPRNVLMAKILEIHHVGENVRINLDGQLNFIAEITNNAFEILDLHKGDEVWASFKATELITTPT